MSCVIVNVPIIWRSKIRCKIKIQGRRIRLLYITMQGQKRECFLRPLRSNWFGRVYTVVFSSISKPILTKMAFIQFRWRLLKLQNPLMHSTHSNPDIMISWNNLTNSTPNKLHCTRWNYSFWTSSHTLPTSISKSLPNHNQYRVWKFTTHRCCDIRIVFHTVFVSHLPLQCDDTKLFWLKPIPQIKFKRFDITRVDSWEYKFLNYTHIRSKRFTFNIWNK